MKPQLVVFDIAGTTLQDDDGVGRAIHAALSAVDVDAPMALINSVMGLPKPQAIRQVIAEVGGERRAELLSQVDTIHADFVRKMIDYYRSDPAVREVAGTSAVFETLRNAGVKVAVDTAFGATITEAILDRLGWRPRIDAWICTDHVEKGRPHPDMIFALMKTLGVSDSKAVCKVGDTPADLGEGTAAGCGWVVGVTGGTHTREQLSGHPHTHLIGTVAELPGLLGIG